MVITLIQMDIKWGDIAANCDVASQLINSEPGSDLYVLPEMFSTGFATEPEGIADDSLQTLKWMQEKAYKINAAICGSVAIKCDDGTYRNRFYFVKPQPNEVLDISSPRGMGDTPKEALPLMGERGEGLGWVSYYDKHHLFTYGNENLHYTPGNERVIVEWRGVRFLLQVCYDLRFPCFSRNHNDYDCILFVASWPTSRINVWNTLLPARAIENQCYVLGVNRIGDDPACSYNGGTQAVDAYGRVIAICPDNEQCAITITLDMDKLTAFRQKFPVLSDAD